MHRHTSRSYRGGSLVSCNSPCKKEREKREDDRLDSRRCPPSFRNIPALGGEPSKESSGFRNASVESPWDSGETRT